MCICACVHASLQILVLHEELNYHLTGCLALVIDTGRYCLVVWQPWQYAS